MNKKIILNLLKTVSEYIMVGAGCFIMALGFNVFCKPNYIAPGGFSGLAAVIYYRFNFPVGICIFLLSLPWFFVLVKTEGVKPFLKTLYGTLMFSLFADLTANVAPLVNDIFLASIFGGLTMGVGVGIVFMFKGTTGGTDLIASVFHRKFPSISSGMWLLIIDCAVVVIAGISLGNIETSLYSAITVYIAMKAIELLEGGFNNTKAFYIISDKRDEIKDEIFQKLDRGVTFLNAKGGYSSEDREILLCIVNRFQIGEIRSIVKNIDRDAFVFSVDVNEVFGEGFEKNK